MTAVMEAVATAAASVAREYALNGVPASPTYPYGVHSASLGRGDVYTLDAFEGVRWGRVVHQSFGKTAESALAKDEEFRSALVGKALTITGYSTTAIRAELDPQIVRDPDNAGVVAVTTTYTFTATKE
jgi:hypothetical protein